MAISKRKARRSAMAKCGEVLPGIFINQNREVPVVDRVFTFVDEDKRFGRDRTVYLARFAISRSTMRVGSQVDGIDVRAVPTAAVHLTADGETASGRKREDSVATDDLHLLLAGTGINLDLPVIGKQQAPLKRSDIGRPG